jgi:hypothetical protein
MPPHRPRPRRADAVAVDEHLQEALVGGASAKFRLPRNSSACKRFARKLAMHGFDRTGRVAAPEVVAGRRLATLAISRREPAGAVLVRHPVQLPQRLRERFGQCRKAVRLSAVSIWQSVAS